MLFNPGEQATLAGEIEFEGIGLHTGASCRVRICGAEVGTGIVFKAGAATIPAMPFNVIDTSRGTSLGQDGEKVVCIEHLLSALAGVGVDNAVCEVIGPELPALDGSCLPYVRKFLECGLEMQGKERPCYRLSQLVAEGRGASMLVASPDDCFSASYLLRYDNPMIGLSFGTFGSKDDFASQIAPARTFGLYAEAEELRRRGLALGAGPQNALIVYDDHIDPELRFPDEFVRHKLLDMIGDLALAGGAVLGSFTGLTTGHSANVAMARRLRESC